MRWKSGRFGAGVALALALAARVSLAQTSGILLADDSRTPRVTVSWERADGTTVTLEKDVALSSEQERGALGGNLEGFVALGGARLEKGAGRASGAIVRVGLVKVDRDILMFDDIANESEIVVELRGVYFNQPAVPDRQTLIQRLRYKADDVVACGLTVNQAEMFNVVSADDDMGGTILPEQVRYQCLGGGDKDGGEAELVVEEDGGISLRAVIPYRLLRHKGDPWAMEVPGSFFEPYQFDLEFEVLPADLAAMAGVEAPRRGDGVGDGGGG